MIAALVLAIGVLPSLPAQIPDWYTTHQYVKYPSDLFILGVGAGTGANANDAAKKAAQTDVVSQIRVQIQAEVKNVSESFQFNKDEQMYSDFRSNVRTAVNDEITGMEVAETVTDNSTGTAYALVVLDRQKFCQTLRSELDAGWKQAGDLRTGAFEFAKQGKLNETIQNLLDARRVITPLLTKQVLYNVVSSAPYKSANSVGPATISVDIRTVLSDVKLAKKGGDKQKGKIGENFQEPFVVQVTINNNGNPVPVIGSAVVFEIGDKIKIGDATTDEQGIASLSTTIRLMTGNGIQARLSIPQLGREFDQNLLSSAVNFTWAAEGSSVSFSVNANVSSAEISSDLKHIFTSAITQIGYTVVSSSQNIIQVTIETGQSTKVEGMAGTLYSVNVDVVVTLVDRTNDNTAGSVTFKGKGLARSEDEALQKAVGNAKVNLSDLSDLLQKAVEKKN